MDNCCWLVQKTEPKIRPSNTTHYWTKTTQSQWNGGVVGRGGLKTLCGLFIIVEGAGNGGWNHTHGFPSSSVNCPACKLMGAVPAIANTLA